ncbi:hypothetical protein R3P93_13290 [Rhodococcus cerastii]|uniref:Uncharacterized protein n=1 Tax=Rhodococcus cerastii TaxID=908616 RepID=A0ABU4D1D9_9NOCA|nr:hypothetical protein [Rhodococcus cerastii]MDV6303534.1 hypothetical protein [Rhodococcus cerastii]
MIDENFPNSLQGVREFATAATDVGQLVAYFGLTAAHFTSVYREPGVKSIDAIDADVGSESDVVGPLLTAHRLAKFYVISCGDALLSCCELIRKDHPMHIGSAALARSAAEHASKAMLLADPEIGWKARVLRAHELFKSSLQEYRSSNDAGATKLIDDWKRWRARTASAFSGVARQPSVGNNRALIERYFAHQLAYDELSRPTHGNATWMTLAVIQEQKGTNYTWCATLRNFCFAMDVCIAASDRLCEFWGLDRDEVLRVMCEKLSLELITWDTLRVECESVRFGVDHLSTNVTIDTSEDPQPER